MTANDRPASDNSVSCLVSPMDRSIMRRNEGTHLDDLATNELHAVVDAEDPRGRHLVVVINGE